jgi:ABC-type transport system involved in Fe-S cluster assembly fused permease/ATPase subunit
MCEQVYRELRQALVDMEALFQLRNVHSGVAEAPNAPDLAFQGGTITFENVKFGYDDSPALTTGSEFTGSSSAPDRTEGEATKSRTILNGLTMTIPAGKTVAIVGASGSGACLRIALT